MVVRGSAKPRDAAHSPGKQSRLSTQRPRQVRRTPEWGRLLQRCSAPPGAGTTRGRAEVRRCLWTVKSRHHPLMRRPPCRDRPPGRRHATRRSLHFPPRPPVKAPSIRGWPGGLATPSGGGNRGDCGCAAPMRVANNLCVVRMAPAAGVSGRALGDHGAGRSPSGAWECRRPSVRRRRRRAVWCGRLHAGLAPSATLPAMHRGRRGRLPAHGARGCPRRHAVPRPAAGPAAGRALSGPDRHRRQRARRERLVEARFSRDGSAEHGQGRSAAPVTRTPG
jgi:hypothetical protein